MSQQPRLLRAILTGAVLLGLAGAVPAGRVLAASHLHGGTGNNGGTVTPATAGGGSVFVGTNHNNTSNPSDFPNQIVMYHRAPSGRLMLIGRFNTGGEGSGPSQRFAGDGLGAANSVWLSQDKHWLFVTNAGSNNVSVFAVHPDGLVLTDIVPTGSGAPNYRFPNSVTQHGNLVYVLNAADQGSITGFRLTPQGTLIPIPGSTRLLGANQQRFAPDPLFDPVEVAFTPSGKQLVIDIKDGPRPGVIPGVTPTGRGRIIVFNVTAQGLPAHVTQTDLNYRGPFGFTFDGSGNMDLAEFIGGGMETINGKRTLTGSAGSFTINPNGSLTPHSLDVPDHQQDTCWVVNNGHYAFGSNYTSGTISSWKIRGDGSLTLLHTVAGRTVHPRNQQGSTPLDERVTPNGKFLYVVLPGSGKVAAWRINPNGSLSKLGEYPGLPQTLPNDHGPFDFSSYGSPAGIEAT